MLALSCHVLSFAALSRHRVRQAEPSYPLSKHLVPGTNRLTVEGRIGRVKAQRRGNPKNQTNNQRPCSHDVLPC